MNSKDPIKGNLKPIIFKLLQEKEEVYAYEVIELIKQKTHHRITITEAALYSTFHKLEAKGILKVEIKSIGNRKRKYYRLTEQGEKESLSELDKIQEFIKSMQLIFYPETKTT